MIKLLRFEKSCICLMKVTCQTVDSFFRFELPTLRRFSSQPADSRMQTPETSTNYTRTVQTGEGTGDFSRQNVTPLDMYHTGYVNVSLQSAWTLFQHCDACFLPVHMHRSSFTNNWPSCGCLSAQFRGILIHHLNDLSIWDPC